MQRSSLIGALLLCCAGCGSTTANPDGAPGDGARTDARASEGTSPPHDRSLSQPDVALIPPGFKPGKITSFPLPADPTAPYSSVRSSKHTNMASIGDRLWVTGGDWLHSATDGTWSMSLVDGSWRQDVGDPVYPTLPAPHALQDGAGFAWCAKRSKFLIWPGSYYAYEPAGTPILEYARGAWWFDPATSTFTQELGLFGTYGSSSGSLFGGIYDEVNDHIVAFGDDSGAMGCKRWDVASLTALPTLAFKINKKPGHAAYFQRGMHVKIGRYVYIIGLQTDGTASQSPIFLRWHLDQHTIEELPPPPVDGTKVVGIEIRMGTSHGRVVWPFMRGPEGDLMGIWIYDPASATWWNDTQVPSYGNFIGNAVTSLPDGRVVWSGGVFGKQQTHIWFYEAQ
jgi:hypothetical protein